MAQKIQRGATKESCKARKSSGNIWCYLLGKTKNAIFTVVFVFTNTITQANTITKGTFSVTQQQEQQQDKCILGAGIKTSSAGCLLISIVLMMREQKPDAPALSSEGRGH